MLAKWPNVSRFQFDVRKRLKLVVRNYCINMFGNGQPNLRNLDGEGDLEAHVLYPEPCAQIRQIDPNRATILSG